MPLFGKKESGRKSKKDLDKVPIEQKYELKELLGTFLATGITFQDLESEFHIAKSTIRGIVLETCRTIWLYLRVTEMPEPDMEMWINIADLFYKKTDFPNCVGAVDGKHIRFRNPKNSGSLFFNYKKFYSIVLMAVADANLLFTAIDVGAYGSEGDSSVFRNSPLGQKLYSKTLNLPKPKCLPLTTTNQQPFVFVGDEAFKLHTNLLRPFPQRNLDPRRRVFNYRLSRCRRSVECAFGVLANKWRIFHTTILVEPEFADDIIKSCCILHNFVRRRDGVNFEDTTSYPLDDIHTSL